MSEVIKKFFSSWFGHELTEARLNNNVVSSENKGIRINRQTGRREIQGGSGVWYEINEATNSPLPSGVNPCYNADSGEG